LAESIHRFSAPYFFTHFSTYEEFMVILTAGILLVSILEFAIELKRTTLLENQKKRILHYEQAFNFLKQS